MVFTSNLVASAGGVVLVVQGKYPTLHQIEHVLCAPSTQVWCTSRISLEVLMPFHSSPTSDDPPTQMPLNMFLVVMGMRRLSRGRALLTCCHGIHFVDDEVEKIDPGLIINVTLPLVGAGYVNADKYGHGVDEADRMLKMSSELYRACPEIYPEFFQDPARYHCSFPRQ